MRPISLATDTTSALASGVKRVVSAEQLDADRSLLQGAPDSLANRCWTRVVFTDCFVRDQAQ